MEQKGLHSWLNLKALHNPKPHMSAKRLRPFFHQPQKAKLLFKIAQFDETR